MEPLSQIALAAGLAWASGFRLYLTILVVGLLGHFHYLDLPPTLAVITNPWVLGAAAVMAIGEFVADKVPWFDSLWDAVHTFIRIPAGAFLAWGAMGDATPAWQAVAAILGGFIATGTHLTKTGTRALLNTSPEPVSNWTMSFGEDGMLLAGLWLVFHHPLVSLVLLMAFLVFVLWSLPKLIRLLGRGLARLRHPPGRLAIDR